VAAHASDSRGQIQLAFQCALSRFPSADETARVEQFLEQQQDLLRSESRAADHLALPIPLPDQMHPVRGAALTDMCLALFNLSEFVYLD
jgi:hypothetical protein